MCLFVQDAPFFAHRRVCPSLDVQIQIFHVITGNQEAKYRTLEFCFRPAFVEIHIVVEIVPNLRKDILLFKRNIPGFIPVRKIQLCIMGINSVPCKINKLLSGHTDIIGSKLEPDKTKKPAAPAASRRLRKGGERPTFPVFLHRTEIPSRGKKC